MLIRFTALHNWKIHAKDGDIGSIDDLFFDDKRWGVRYFVVRTGHWLSSRRVLLSPVSFRRPIATIGSLQADLTRAQIESSPDVDADKPVSRRHEIAHAVHYGYPLYWSGTMPGNAHPPPDAAAVSAGYAGLDIAAVRAEEAVAEQSHLRSAREVVGYRVTAVDGEAGDLDDLVVDDQAWAVRHLVVDAQRWWPGGLVLVDPTTAVAVDWQERRLTLNISRDRVRHAQPLV